MAQPQRKSSWSFSLRDDEQSDSSQEEQIAQPQPSGRRSEHEKLIAEAEQEGVADHAEPELFDISMVEEGDVRFVETPFTIARRVAATRKRARKEKDEIQEEPRPKPSQPLPPAAPPKAKKSKFDPPIKKSKLPRKTSKAPPATESKSEAPSTSKLSPSKSLPALSPLQSTVEATDSESTYEMPSPRVPAATLSKPGGAVLPSFSSPKSAVPLSASSSTARNVKGLKSVSAKSSFSRVPRKVPTACDEAELGDAERGNEEASVLGSDDSSWDHRTVSSLADTLPSSPPPRSPPASRSNGMMLAFSSNGKPRFLSDGNRAPQFSSDKTSSLAPLPSPQFKSKPSPRSIKPSSSNEGADDSTLLSDDVQFIEEDQAPTFAPRTPRRNRNPAFAPLIPPRSQAQKPSSVQPIPSTPHKSSPRKLSDLSPPTGASPRRSHPIASSPSRARPRPTPPRPSAPTTNAHWSTLSSRSRPSLVPTPSAYGSALDGIASTSAAATRIALPEFAPQGGGVAVRPSAGGSRRMGFKPAESLSAFKGRVEKEKKEEQERGGRAESEVGEVGEEAQEKILLGANLRSVKPGTLVSVDKSNSSEQGGKSSLYGEFKW
ncbi:hypothetical protein BCR35DRAFT_351026 [Leucosporidium creatinivorum]|uniref:Uncharacterized protein n=1 Tax=Leucosporidium creatinivorum TaxID=106004 RepID=A0A1Y2FW02_9BASI|nr:hypothetical protein BCR35DRAFT_351026 [Leucosporidium creatinivorum]